MTTPDAQTDEDLMETYYRSPRREETDGVFAELERRYRTRLVLSLTLAGYNRGFVKLPRMPGRNELADEMATETLFKAAGTRGRPSARFHPDRKSFRAWLFGILHNVAVSHLRRRRLHLRSSTDVGLNATGEQLAELEAIPANGPSPEDEVLHRAIVEATRACREELPAELRQLCELIFERCLKQTEVARVMNLTQPTLTRRKQEACKRLGDCLRRRCIPLDVLSG